MRRAPVRTPVRFAKYCVCDCHGFLHVNAEVEVLLAPTRVFSALPQLPASRPLCVPCADELSPDMPTFADYALR